MRLTPAEIEAIRLAVRQVFGEASRVHVFGSRVHDDSRGGDLDLLVEVGPDDASIANEQRLRDLIAPALDDLRIDIILRVRGRVPTPIERIALRDGVPL